jgi:hypothetical protein
MIVLQVVIKKINKEHNTLSEPNINHQENTRHPYKPNDEA